jgi:hypothetical protein
MAGVAIDDVSRRLRSLFHAAAAEAGIDRRCHVIREYQRVAATTQNSPIRNENAEYFDAGVKQRVTPGLTIGVDLYYKYAHNLLDEGQFGAPIILMPLKYKLGIDKGVELITEYNVGRRSSYSNLAIANQLAKGIESVQFNFSPDDLVTAGGMFVNTDHSQLKTASAGIAYLWRGTRFTADLAAGSGLRTVPDNDLQFNGETLPSRQQLNLGVSHVFPPMAARSPCAWPSSTCSTRSISCAA